MSGRIVPVDQSGHNCRDQQPWRSGGYGSTGQPDGTLWICDCERAYIARPCYESLRPTQTWRPVRWWNFEARKRLAAAVPQEEQ